MSDERRRRRRRTAQNGPRRSAGPASGATPWLITIVAAVAVVAGGWFLGQALARAFGGNDRQTAQTGPSPLPVVTPFASPSAAAATPEASPGTPAPTPVHTAIRTRTPGPTQTPEPTQSPEATPTPVPAQTPQPTPAPTRAATANPATPKPLPVPTAFPSRAAHVAPGNDAGSSAAEQTVRSYIAALVRGDPQSAAAYLGNGVPDESFIDGSARIEAISQTPHADGSSTVSVELRTNSGRYRENFEVAAAADGSRILQKSVAKE
ncbi:MAG TPA: hypothetical protein VFA29_03865 [Candidatus Baltobacteraceae bacterium]|nr:hypothetical protein [Candidatus Baltobacteraceae bacterium]